MVLDFWLSLKADKNIFIEYEVISFYRGKVSDDGGRCCCFAIKFSSKYSLRGWEAIRKDNGHSTNNTSFVNLILVNESLMNVRKLGINIKSDETNVEILVCQNSFISRDLICAMKWTATQYESLVLPVNFIIESDWNSMSDCQLNFQNWFSLYLQLQGAVLFAKVTFLC